MPGAEDILPSDWDAGFVKNTLKLMKKIKHPAPADIIAKKKIIKYVDIVYEGISEPTRNNLLAMGMPQLEPLFKKEEGMTMLFVNSGNREEVTDTYTALSKILMRLVDDSDDEDLFCLPPEFLLQIF